MSALTRQLREIWSRVAKLGLNRLPGVRPVARAFKDMLFRWEYGNREWIALPDAIKIYLRDDPNNLIKVDYLDYLKDGSWQKLTVQLFRELLHEGQNAVDIGAAFGYLSVVASQAVGSTGRVFSFEPEQTAFRNLTKNIELNQATNVVATNCGISDGTRTTTMLFGTACGGTIMGGTRTLYNLPQAAQGEIPLTSLDAFLASHGWPPITLLKIDVEGAEVLAFQGMAETFARNPNMVILSEVSPAMLEASGFRTEDFFDILQRAGFNDFTDITGQKMRPFDPRIDVDKLKRMEIGNAQIGTADLMIRRS